LESLKNLFYTGSYQAAAESSPLAASSIEAQVLHYQAMLALGDANLVLSELSDYSHESPAELQALRHLAHQHLSTATEDAVFDLEKLLQESHGKNGLLASLVALFYIREGLFSDALRALSPFQNLTESPAFIDW
jgi:hypothetical protein